MDQSREPLDTASGSSPARWSIVYRNRCNDKIHRRSLHRNATHARSLIVGSAITAIGKSATCWYRRVLVEHGGIAGAVNSEDLHRAKRHTLTHNRDIIRPEGRGRSSKIF